MTTPSIEEFANIEHERWSKWQQWVFDCSTENEDGSVTIPADKVERWKRQIATPYAELSEKEKQSDRDQVYPYIKALTQAHQAGIDEVVKAVGKNKPVIVNMLQEDSLFIRHGIDGVIGYNEAKKEIIKALQDNK